LGSGLGEYPKNLVTLLISATAEASIFKKWFLATYFSNSSDVPTLKLPDLTVAEIN